MPSETVLAEKRENVQAAEIGYSVVQLGDCVADAIRVVVLQLTGDFPLGQERGAVGRILSYSHKRGRERLAQRRGSVAARYKPHWLAKSGTL
jgi:hypothetical protein